MLTGCQTAGIKATLQLGAPPLRVLESHDAMDGLLPVQELHSAVAMLIAAHAAQSPTLFPRLVPPSFDVYGETPHTSIADDVAAEFRALGLKPVEEHFTRGGHDFCNVYADIPARGRSDGMIILSAHHDTWYTPADDNSTGVAILFAAAKLLRHAAPARTIRLLAFDGEELGLLGSEAYVAAHAADPVKLVVNLDCMAYASEAPDSQRSPTGLTLPSTGDFLLAVGNTGTQGAIAQLESVGAGLPSPLAVEGGAMDVAAPNFLAKDVYRSDHASFWDHGVPAIFLTDTGPFRDDRYHTANDTLDSLDWPFFQRTALATVVSVALYADCRLPAHLQLGALKPDAGT